MVKKGIPIEIMAETTGHAAIQIEKLQKKNEG